MAVVSTRFALLLTLHKNMKYYGKTYCWPTREQIVEGIRKITGRLYSISWADDLLGELKRDKFIISYRNYGRYDDGTVFAKASNRQFTKKALVLFIKTGVKVAKQLWDVSKKVLTPSRPLTATRDKYPEPQEKRPPQHGKNPFLNPGSRRSLGLPEIPPFEPEKA